MRYGLTGKLRGTPVLPATTICVTRPRPPPDAFCSSEATLILLYSGEGLWLQDKQSHFAEVTASQNMHTSYVAWGEEIADTNSIASTFLLTR